MNESLQNWFNEQHLWIQEAAHRFLTNGPLGEKDVIDLVSIIKSTIDKKSPQKPLGKSYPSFPVGGAGTQSVRLCSIEEVTGIDRLCPRKPIEFTSNNLVVIYGNNGSGKTGYARILKRMCGKAGSLALRHNVFEKSPAKQGCKVSFSVDTISHTCEWLANESPIVELNSVDLFDTVSCSLYLDTETDVPFSPPELVLLSALVDICQQVRLRLESERDSLTSALPHLPIQYKETETGKAFSSLRANMKVEDVNAAFTWTAKDSQRHQELSSQSVVKDPAVEAKKRKIVHAQVEGMISTLRDALHAVSQDECRRIYELRERARSAKSIAVQGSVALSENSELEGVGSSTWKAMWESARSFSTSHAYPHQGYPYLEEEAKCVLCHQELSIEAKGRFIQFEEFVKGSLETEAANCERAVQASIERLPKAPDQEQVLTFCLAAELEPQLTEEVISAWSLIQTMVQQLSTEMLVSAPIGVFDSQITVVSSLSVYSSKVENSAKNYEKQSLNDDRQARESETLELQAKKWTSEQRAAIDAEIVRLSSVAVIDAQLKQTLTTKLSNKVGDLSKELITDAFIERFNSELKTLGASRLQVELVRTKIAYGKVKHKIRLKNAENHKVSEVLSEGESRIVCLASFLASVTGKPGCSSFIFDDPISSLDQDFEEKVIDRLIELSKTRQVIVLTHRLSFLSIARKADPELITIRQEAWGTGEPGDMPIFAEKPSRALNKLLNERLAQAKKEYKNNGTEAYYPLAKAICSDVRILIERIVELTLLADVIQRHRRDVNTKGKVKHLLKITHDDCALIDKFMTEYSKYEHSQSYEAPVSMPTPDELENDLKNLTDWHEEFLKRPLP